MMLLSDTAAKEREVKREHPNEMALCQEQAGTSDHLHGQSDGSQVSLAAKCVRARACLIGPCRWLKRGT